MGNESPLLPSPRGKNPNSLGSHPIPLPLIRHVAALLLGMLNHARLIHHVPLSKRDELLEVIRKQLASGVDPANKGLARLLDLDVLRSGAPPYSSIDDATSHYRYDVCERETGVHDEDTFRSFGRSS